MFRDMDGLDPLWLTLGSFPDGNLVKSFAKSPNNCFNEVTLSSNILLPIISRRVSRPIEKTQRGLDYE